MKAMIPLLTIPLVGLVVGFLFQFITASNAKRAKKLHRDGETIVRNPTPFIWVGIIETVFAGSMLSVGVIYPNGNGTWLVNSSKTLILECIIWGVFILMGLFIIQCCLLFKLKFSRKKNYFIYKSSYGITHKISYEDITYYKSTSGSFELHIGRKFYSISNFATNLSAFVKMLKEKNVPSYEVWIAEHPKK